jgi:hypothetical protein
MWIGFLGRLTAFTDFAFGFTDCFGVEDTAGFTEFECVFCVCVLVVCAQNDGEFIK